MPFIFRCDYCGEETELDLGTMWKDPSRNCVGCGEDVCVKCINGEFCDDCVAEMERLKGES